MRINKFLIVSAFVIFLVQASPVFAEGPKGLIEDVQRFEKRASMEAQKQTQKVEKQKDNLAKLKKRADQEIDKRIAGLNKLQQRIQNDQKLSADEKSSISTDIQSDITGLTALKVKMDADSDLTTLKSDAQQIVTNFKVFKVAEPKIRLLITIDNLQAETAKILSFTPKIQDLINTLKSEGKDVSKLQSLLDDINNRLTATNSQLSSDRSLVLGVTISTTDPNSTFTQVRKDLAGVRQSFGEVRHDFSQMRDTFRLIITGGNSGNGSASVSPSATPTPSASPSI